MKFTYDPRYNVAYIRFHEKKGNIESIHVSYELVVDMAPDGTIYGLELLNANEQLLREDKGKLIVVNEATGKHLIGRATPGFDRLDI
ncbi:hypothetical protein ES703_13465 [subsurface metagenome]